MLALALALLLQAADGPALYPTEFTLHGPASRQTLLFESRSGGLHTGAIRDGVTYTSSDPKIVRIDGTLAVPLANGRATITAASPQGRATAAVVVLDMEKPFDHSFRNHVQPILARFGCSSGACHGAAAGKSGFKLSLRGYDDDGDYATLTRHALGRRVNLEDPGRSLVLLKPTGALPHKGGIRFDTASREYAVLSEWIAAGAPGPKAEDPRIDHLSIVPSHVVLTPGSEQQILVRAHFSDGSIRDATPWAKYTASDSTVAVPDEEGRIKVTGNGEGAITAWFLSKIAVATVTVPYANDLAPDTFTKAPRRNFIDELTLAKLKELNLPPSPPAGDSDFLRRAFLDTIGVLPTAEETRAFLADPAPDKRDRIIDALLERPEYVDYWTHRWGDLLLVSSKKLPAPTMWAYHAWIRNQVAANTPWDRFARQVVTARGGTIENGAGSFFVLQDDPSEMAQTVSQAFLGMSIQCARCHNHPMEKWTNDQYYAFANLFARVRTKNGGRAGDTIIFTAADGELIQPLTNRPRAPQPLDGTAISFDDPRDRREALADWLTGPENPYFSRSIVNRVWANFLSRGLVEAVDDMRKTNPPSNEALLTALADHLAQHHFDLKALMRTILQSQTYQRSSRPLPGNATEKRFYSRYYPRRMMAEVALDALSQVTGAPTVFKQAAERGPSSFAYPVGWRALQLPDTNIDSYFLKSFGRPDRIITCECERTAAPSMSQALHIANGDTLNQKLRAKGNRIERLLADKTEDGRIVDELYFAALSRPPSPEEKSRLTALLAGAGAPAHRDAVEDLFWGILSSKEFLFNH